ncbi:hypothetical protein [Novosphingobium guangzhouense]|uniref:Argininosuccinate lyase n=1 Tax=Novosphingobium guangzhouense TaxID=1850347 RepID=A0A2K2G260_9SPHN|nr:hypothetical protein [Novosphingobium guangzhouense]PNU05123.1 hypothetical protein A8V01_04715 [Novosphingobium guangzhouense]
MIACALFNNPRGKALLGFAALLMLGGCNPASGPTPTESATQDAAAEAKARAKAEREAKLAAFYGGDAPAEEDKDALRDEKPDTPAPRPPGIATSAPQPPSLPPPSISGAADVPPMRPPAPDPGIGKVE